MLGELMGLFLGARPAEGAHWRPCDGLCPLGPAMLSLKEGHGSVLQGAAYIHTGVFIGLWCNVDLVAIKVGGLRSLILGC